MLIFVGYFNWWHALKNPDISDFNKVTPLENPDKEKIEIEIQKTFFSERNKDDLVLFFFSGHGILDDTGKLYLAARNTRKSEHDELIKGIAEAL